MDKMKLLISRILMILFCFIGCTGCWDHKELKTQGIVAAIGVDRFAGSKGIYRYTLQVIKANEVSQPKGKTGGGAGGGAPVWVRTGTGRTPYEAGRNISLQSSRRMFFSHSQALIIGKGAAQLGVRQMIDSDMRFYQIRNIQNFLIA
ncbi:MAG TPA: hypothetical protein VHY08_08220, partial [Bacillota bacterium]|nr:hypothetical protein [Bacillota bacterium]